MKARCQPGFPATLNLRWRFKVSQTESIKKQPRSQRHKRKNRCHEFHGKKLSREYSSWRAMLNRCTRLRDEAYPRYGGRGITVCDRWLYSFTAFLEDMGPRPDGMELDRIDTNGNYEPGNCRWATRDIQANNRRNNRTVTISGVTKTIAEWSKDSGVKWTTAASRLLAGIVPELAFDPTYNGRKTVNPGVPYRGVTVRPNGKFQASLGTKDRRIYLGVYDTAEQAAIAYNAAALNHRGSKAKLNVLPKQPPENQS